MEKFDDLHEEDASERIPSRPSDILSSLHSNADKDSEISGADIATALRVHIEQISEEVRARYAQYYAHSDGAALDEDFAIEWNLRELNDFFDCVENDGATNGNYVAWVGDAVSVHYELLSPLANRLEMILLYAEVCANFVWEAFVGDSTRLKEATAVFERCIEKLLASDSAVFFQETLVPGALMKTWKLGPRRTTDLIDSSKEPPRSSMAEFSHRQLQIVQLVAEGRSNGEIATALGISANTVKNHLALIFDKLNVNSRTELALYAMREGFVQDPS